MVRVGTGQRTKLALRNSAAEWIVSKPTCPRAMDLSRLRCACVRVQCVTPSLKGAGACSVWDAAAGRRTLNEQRSASAPVGAKLRPRRTSRVPPLTSPYTGEPRS